MPLKKSLRKPQRLGPCKEQFLSLLNLFLSLRVEFVHSIEKRATNFSHACSHVQSGASTPGSQSKGAPKLDCTENQRFPVSYSPGWCRNRCRRRRRQRE